VALLILFGLAASGGGVAVAQTERGLATTGEAPPRQDNSDEIVVRGKRPGDLRLAVESAREHAYDVFDEIQQQQRLRTSAAATRSVPSRTRSGGLPCAVREPHSGAGREGIYA